jgi:hypothetical protein
MKLQEYVTDKEFTIDQGRFKGQVLPAHSFVKPIEDRWVPAEVKKSIIRYNWAQNPEIYVYCFYGIISIPKKLVREIC